MLVKSRYGWILKTKALNNGDQMKHVETQYQFSASVFSMFKHLALVRLLLQLDAGWERDHEATASCHRPIIKDYTRDELVSNSLHSCTHACFCFIAFVKIMAAVERNQTFNFVLSTELLQQKILEGNG